MVLQPLYHLLNQDVKWFWSDKCEEAFEKCKQLLTKDNVLMPFDPRLDIVVTCDSSSYGVGCVIAHELPDKSERPVAFASRTLNKSEVKYSQIEKEALALIFAVKKFHKFLYARKFTLVTDHRPLTFLLSPTKGIPTMAAARIQRWALILSGYQYSIRYKKGKDISHADGLLRLPSDTGEEGEVAFFLASYKLPITAREIAVATRFDPVLAKVLDFTNNGWPSYTEDPDMRPYSNKSLQLSVDRGCLMWGNRVVIPPTHRKEILVMLHAEHPGESRMKNLARSYIWWPGMDQDIEAAVKECLICQQTRKSAPVAPLQSWTWPRHNWQRIHLDFAEFEKQNFLILVDSHSKWIEVFLMTLTTSKSTIEKLRHCFAAFGLPCTVVTDGGPQFRSSEFQEFLKANGVNHTLSPPYHPASNGLAERAVQTVKDIFLKQMLHDTKHNSHRTWQHRIDSFLFTYRNTPHSMTGMTPAETMLKFKPRTHLSLLKPHLAADMELKQEGIERSVNVHRGKARQFSLHDKVFVRTVRNEKVNWQPGIVSKVVSPVTYLVRVDGRTRFVHVDHLRTNKTGDEDEEEDVTLQFPRELYQSPRGNKSPPQQKPETPIRKGITPPVTNSPQRSPSKPTTNTPQEDASLRRSQRPRRAPKKLDL